MFKNTIIYRITTLPIDALGADDALQDHQFTPCGASQEKSIGSRTILKSGVTA